MILLVHSYTSCIEVGEAELSTLSIEPYQLDGQYLIYKFKTLLYSCCPWAGCAQNTHFIRGDGKTLPHLQLPASWISVKGRFIAFITRECELLNRAGRPAECPQWETNVLQYGLMKTVFHISHCVYGHNISGLCPYYASYMANGSEYSTIFDLLSREPLFLFIYFCFYYCEKTFTSGGLARPCKQGHSLSFVQPPYWKG